MECHSFVFKIIYYKKTIIHDPLMSFIGEFNSCFLSRCRIKSGSSKSFGSLFLTFLHYHKTEKVFENLLRHFGHVLKTYHQRFESFSDSFQTHKISHHEKRPSGVLFKLFSGSLNIKILSSDLVFFTLVKALEELFI